MKIKFDREGAEYTQFYCVRCSIFDSPISQEFDCDRYFADDPEALLGHLLLHKLAGERIPVEVLVELQQLLREEGLCQKSGIQLESKLNTLMLTRNKTQI